MDSTALEGSSNMAGNLGDTLHLELISHSGPQLHLSYRFAGGLRFTTTVWYDFSLDELHERFGDPFMENIYFHCAMFELNKLCTLSPSLALVDLGNWSHFLSERLESLWRTVAVKGFGEWRYSNNLPHWKGPKFSKAHDEKNTSTSVVNIDTSNVSTHCLTFCGGGKDSTVAMKILEELSEPFATLACSFTNYGQAEHQHKLIDGVLDHCATARRHRLRIYDDFHIFLDSPRKIIPNLSVKTVMAAETWSTVFEVIPIALKYGYTQLCLANEQSSNTGNLTWDATGEEINHQWGKSFEAESLLSSYIKEKLINNLHYYSLLMPIYESLIFQLLSQHLMVVPFTHSCNFNKPWCLRCPKCCYVWLGYVAYLPEDTVSATFGSENVLDVDENQLFFFQMLGLGDQTPFECLGLIDEVRLAFALCRCKGIKGKAMQIFEENVAPEFNATMTDIVSKLFKVISSDHGIPQPLANKVIEKFKVFSEAAQKKCLQMLSQ